MGSAQLDSPPFEAVLQTEPAAGSPGQGSLRQEMAERLAAHRARRSRMGNASVQARLEMELPAPVPGKRKIAAAVAERYAHSPSYRAFLAEEAQRAIRQAAAAAEVAARSAEAVATAQQQLLDELELWTAPQSFTAETAVTHAVVTAPEVTELQQPKNRPEAVAPLRIQSLPVQQQEPAGLVVRLYEDAPRTPALLLPDMHRNEPVTEQSPEEVEALKEEIAFRQTPVFDDYRDFGGKVEPIAANLVEFPRQLVAARKVRPRLAEGPLREELPRTPQLRIFEVEPEQMAQEPASLTSTPEWSNIRLEAHTNVGPAAFVPEDELVFGPLAPQIAPMPLRIMAVATDLALVFTSVIAFAAMASWIAGVAPRGLAAAKILVGALAVFYLLYQALFFTLSDQTPGMRLARIGFCTMADENPSRSAMRRRILAFLVALCPLGIGIFWIFLDDERLGWHDRISRMYQRAY